MTCNRNLKFILTKFWKVADVGVHYAPKRKILHPTESMSRYKEKGREIQSGIA